DAASANAASDSTATRRARPARHGGPFRADAAQDAAEEATPPLREDCLSANLPVENTAYLLTNRVSGRAPRPVTTTHPADARSQPRRRRPPMTSHLHHHVRRRCTGAHGKRRRRNIAGGALRKTGGKKWFVGACAGE